MFSKGFLWNLWADNRVIRNMTCWIAIRSQMQSIGRMRKLPKTAGIYIRSILVIKSEINSSGRSCIKWWTEHYGMQKKKRKESLLPEGIANLKLEATNTKICKLACFCSGPDIKATDLFRPSKERSSRPLRHVPVYVVVVLFLLWARRLLVASANLLCCTSWPQTCDSSVSTSWVLG